MLKMSSAMKFRFGSALLAWVALAAAARGDEGYRLWLRYERIPEETVRARYTDAIREVVLATPSGADSATIAAACRELAEGLVGLLGADVPARLERLHQAPVRILRGDATPSSRALSEAGDGGVAAPDDTVFAGIPRGYEISGPGAAGRQGYELQSVRRDRGGAVRIAANSDLGVLYGVFALLRLVQTHQPLENLRLVGTPKIRHRILNHWDNLDRTVERGYAGQSLWEWFQLPDYVSPRYRDYARANASIGINGAVLTNVNADALVLTAPYLAKVAALADVFRPYGIRVYLTARFNAPMEIGGLATADPLDPTVVSWWRAKTDEVYRWIPDFGGYLVKANSEGQPGPQDFGRSHADGANLLADALAPHGGIVMWRAFVYRSDDCEDRAKQAFNEFCPLDGKFRPNVVVQVKSGPIDFMPREPFHPLFGAMPRTPLALELQITQEYFGGAIRLAYLAPQYKETLDSDTFAAGPGSTVARVVDGTLGGHALTLIAGVANTGTDRNWCGHPLASSNWYAFGRLTWDHTLGAAAIADEWARMTLSNDPRVIKSVAAMLLASREAAVDYSMPLGLHHIMDLYHHYGPAPWFDEGRPDWRSTYYHRADAKGIGFDRTASGSNALGQYAPEAAQRWADPATCPDEFLLWFHHVPWDRRLRSGRTLWDELCLHYQRGVDAVRGWQKSWAALEDAIDAERFSHVRVLLARQEREARWWRDACVVYFQTFSQRPLPAGVEPPEHPLEFYKSIRLQHVPGTPMSLYKQATLQAGDGPWGRVGVSQADGGFVAELENGRILVRYGRDGDRDKIVEFRCKATGRNLGEFDSRHNPTNPTFFTLKDARVVLDGPGKKTVRLDFGSRVQDVSICKDCPVLEIDYHTLNDYGHANDRGGETGEIVVYGAEEWLRARQRMPDFPPASPAIDRRELYPMYEKSYYRAEWGDAGPLSYKGWMIMGVCHQDGGGYGLLLPADKIKWLKLMTQRRPWGFERAMKSPYKACYFRVTQGGTERIMSMGKEIIDGAFENAGLTLATRG
ncbi:MAG: hypothetical protein A3G75_09580 [Verrucomicrobia bacterium RIFCSPLOWO2_12_FULL_64_8]|nr:MAG: hypothetical protein A3G75_09580 [Verrucomicrobia bacterium RIFCSPLOWO2_12_FULL_64_8]